MKKLFCVTQVLMFSVAVCFAAISPKSSVGHNSNAVINTITGQVLDPYRNPVADVYVELQTNFYSTLDRIKTDGSGRFSFSGIQGGRYNIKVLTLGTNYKEQTQSVEVVNLFPGASDVVFIDIHLKFDKTRLDLGLSGITDVVFVQEVPDEARQLYKKGSKKINGKDEEGFEEIEQSLKIFPDYYDALNLLGSEYVKRNQYEKSLPYLINAITVNQKSFSSFYSLAYACYQLGYKPEALKAARGAAVLQPNSLNAQLLYGKLLRVDGSYEKAAEALLKAKSLSKDMPVAEIHWQLALVYNRLEKNKEAAEELETYLKLNPEASDKKEIKDLIVQLRLKAKQ